MTPTFQEIINNAKEKLVKDKEHPPLMTVSTNGKIDVFNVSFRNDIEKQMIMSMLKLAVQTRKPEHYFIAFESWLTSYENDSEESAEKMFKKALAGEMVRPSKHPEKKEALVIEQHCKDMTSNTCVIFFTRDKNNNIILGEEHNVLKNEVSYSAFNFYLEGR